MAITTDLKKNATPMLKNRFLYGLVWGIVLPLVAFPLFHFIDKGIVENDIINKLMGSSAIIWAGFKLSTLVLFALCTNLIPTYFANKQLKEEFVRGIMVPTVLYCFVWFFYYKSSMLGF